MKAAGHILRIAMIIRAPIVLKPIVSVAGFEAAGQFTAAFSAAVLAASAAASAFLTALSGHLRRHALNAY